MCSFDFASFEGFLIFNDTVGCLAPLSTAKEISAAIISYTNFSHTSAFLMCKGHSCS